MESGVGSGALLALLAQLDRPPEIGKIVTVRKSRDFYEPGWEPEQIAAVEDEYIALYHEAVQELAAAWEPPDVVPDKNKFWPDEVRRVALRTLAAAQVKVGQTEAAQAWIAKLSTPTLRAFAFLGLAEGIAERPAQEPKSPSESPTKPAKQD
jgi:hypothetical protein